MSVSKLTEANRTSSTGGGARATRGARSEEDVDICARHRRHATVSSASFAFPEGARHRARAACRVYRRAAIQGCSRLSSIRAEGSVCEFVHSLAAAA